MGCCPNMILGVGAFPPYLFTHARSTREELHHCLCHYSPKDPLFILCFCFLVEELKTISDVKKLEPGTVFAGGGASVKVDS